MFRVRGHLQAIVSAQLLLCCWIFCYSLFNFRPALAESEHHNSSSINLDLTSTSETVSGALLGQNVTLNVGGTTTTVTSSSTLTPAEYLAAMSVINSGQQTLNLNSAGQAVSGTFQVPTSTSLSNIVVPTGVTGVYDFASNQNLGLIGNFTNSGNFYLVSSSQGVNSGTLSALNIINNSGALLSSVLPATGISGFCNLNSSLSFNLVAVNNIVNYGTIASSGSLNMLAGNQIINGATSALASISAVNNITMITPSISNQGQITAALNNINLIASNVLNSGLLQSVNGEISISSLVNRVLDINNMGGIISAGETLSFRNNSSSSVISVNGGSLFAEQISFFDPSGSVSVNVSDISNNVVFKTHEIGLSVSNGTSGLNVSGLDRANSVGLVYNGTGDVSTSGFETNGQNVSITTSGAIDIDGNIVSSPSGSAGNGGNVLLSAGSSLSVQDIITTGVGSGNGGNISLTAGTSIQGGDLNASGGSTGNPGVISISAGTSASFDNITGNGVSGGGNISINAPGEINVNGAISAVDGTVSVSSPNLNVGEINLGGGSLNWNPETDDDSPFVLNLEQLASFGSGSVNIGGANGLASDIVISGNCNLCLGNLQNVTLSTNGSYTATGTTLVLDSNQSFSVIANGGINTGSVSGGENVSFISQGTVTVDGPVSMAGGSLTLSGTGFEFDSQVNVGNGTISLIPTANATVDGNQLGMLMGSTLNIGNGSGSSGMTINGNANLTQIADHVVVSLGGNFDSSNASIALSNNASMSVSANNVNVGSILNGNGLVVNANGELGVHGNIYTNGPLALHGDLAATGASVNLNSGNYLTASSIAISSGLGDITTGAELTSTEANIDINSGGALTILNNSRLISAGDLSLQANGNLAIGSANEQSNVTISAGAASASFDPFNTDAPFHPSMLRHNGRILIDTFQSGFGSGDVSIGSNVRLTSFGNGENGSGSLGILSAGNIDVASGSQLAAVGGDLWISAAKNVTIDGAELVSLASSSSEAGSHYSGGQIGIMAGAPHTDMVELLADLSATREGRQIIDSDVNLDGNRIAMVNGSILSVIQPEDLLITLSNNTVNLNGGVLFIDPPPSSTVNISGTTITAAGPAIDSTPVVIGGGSGGTGTGGGGTGGIGGVGGGLGSAGSDLSGGLSGGTGGAAGGGAGNILAGGSEGSFSNLSTSISTVSSSSVNSTDTSSKSSNNSQQVVGIQVNGQSTVPSDTLEEGTGNKPPRRSSMFCSKPQLLKTSDSIDEDSWIIASSSCQPFTFEEHDGSLIVGGGADPAKFAPSSDRTLLLREGKLLFVTVDKIHVVRTPYCNITIPVNTAAVVEVDTQGMVRIANFAGGKASITVCRNDETLILSAAPGEQLVLAETTIADEKFSNFGYPDVSHTKVAAWQLELSGLRGQKIRFDRKEMAQAEPLLHCSMGCVNQTQLRRIEQLMQSMTTQQELKSMLPSGKGKQLIRGAVPVAANPMKPVSFQNHELQTPQISLRTLNAGTAQVKYVGKCRFSLSRPGLLELHEGEALISAPKRTLVKIGSAIVEFKPGTVAIVGQKDGLAKVRNIYEKKSTGASVNVAGKKLLGVQVGQEVIVGPKGVSLVKTLSQDPVGRRRLSSLELASGHTCVSSEFSLSSLIQNSPILAQLVRSDNATDRDIAAKILKMSVCVSIVTSSHGNYSMMNP